MSTKDDRIEKALDTLAELCGDTGNEQYGRRSAAEEILRHYRETEMVKNIVITVNGAVPVRPMTRAEVAQS